MPLPPLETQKKLAAVLDQADALIASSRARLSLTDALTSAVFLDMFGDPVANPMGWPLKAFGEICPTRLGKMLDKKTQTDLERRPYLRNANVRWLDFDLAELAEMDFSDHERTKYRVERGDVLICEGGSEPGRAAVWRGQVDEIFFQKALHRGRPEPLLATPDYVAHLLWHLDARGGLVDHIASATIGHLTGERLKVMRVPTPPVALQHEFTSRLQEIDRCKDRLMASEMHLHGLLASLHHRAFRGEL